MTKNGDDDGWDVRPRGNCLIWAVAFVGGVLAAAFGVAELLTRAVA